MRSRTDRLADKIRSLKDQLDHWEWHMTPAQVDAAKHRIERLEALYARAAAKRDTESRDPESKR